MKIKHSVHIMLFVVVTSDGNIMPPFIFPHDQIQHRGLHQVPGGFGAVLD